MNANSVPITPEEMNAAWLEYTLDVSVSSVQIEAIGEGSGFAGSVYRMHLTDAESNAALPNTLIWKTVSGDHRTRHFLTTLGAYEREARFYGELADNVEAAPNSYFSYADPNSGVFCLITEDVSYMKPGDQVRGCSLTEALAVIREAARLHSMFWTKPPDWIPTFDGGSGYFQKLHSVAWRQLERSAFVVPDGLIEVARQMAPRVQHIKERLSLMPITLVHGDLRLDNVFFGIPPAADRIKLIDWQAIRVGRGMYDIAYFLSTSVPTEIRRLRQDELMSAYVESLLANGVTGYTLADCNEDFRWALLDIVTFVGVIGSTLDFQSARGLELSETIMSRLWQTIEDNSALDMLE